MTILRLTLLSAFLLMTSIGNAAIVNVDGTWEFWRYRYSPIEFQAGHYRVSPIGVADGGSFNAWNAWGFGEVSGCDSAGVCERGYLNSYSFGYVDQIGFVQEVTTVGGRVDNGTAIAYASAESALANGQSYTFTLSAPTQLYFYVRDFESAYSDNTGGMSLNVEFLTPIPEPDTWLLMLAALIVLGVATRKKPNQCIERTAGKRCLPVRFGLWPAPAAHAQR